MRESDLGMSNFDRSIDEGLEEVLKAFPGEVYGTYAGWDFHARVWFEDGQFHAEVWRYRSPQKVFSCDTLHEIMSEVSSEYGYD